MRKGIIDVRLGIYSNNSTLCQTITIIYTMYIFADFSLKNRYNH